MIINVSAILFFVGTMFILRFGVIPYIVTAYGDWGFFLLVAAIFTLGLLIERKEPTEQQ